MGVYQSLAAEVTEPLDTGGEKARRQMLFLTRSLFGMAAFALIAIVVTVSATYFALDRTSRQASESRRIARIARSIFIVAGERELARRFNDAWRDDASQKADAATLEAKRFALEVDALKGLVEDDPERKARFAHIDEAQERWTSTLDSPLASSSRARGLRERQTFEYLRSRLSDFLAVEDAKRSDTLARETDVRLYSTAAILAELLVLLSIISGIRRRLVIQATEVLGHKDELERQAVRLRRQALEMEASNAELASAIRVAEEQADEQRALLTAITEVFFVLDREGRYHKVAPENHDLLGRPGEQLVGRLVQEVLPPPVAAVALTSISKALNQRRRVDIEYSLDMHGKTIWFMGTVTPLGEDRVLWVARDVSESKLAAEAIKESEARFRNLVEHSPQAVALHAEGRLLYANPACASLLGYASEDQLVGKALIKFITPETAPRFIDSVASFGRSPTRAVTCECQFKRPSDPRPLIVEVTSVPVIYSGRAGVLSILHDVTERRQLEDQLAHQAFHDPLTNLANRVLFRDRVEHALQRAVRGSALPSVLFIDLDNFKAVNDGLGHSAGDWLLIEVAARLSNCLRPADTVARLGGDEFAVLIDDEVANARVIAERILQAFRSPFSVQNTDIVVTMSIGIASLQPHQGADEVLRNADLALYRAKAEGKACAASFEPEMHVAALRRLELEGELRHAIQGEGIAGKLVIYYQPITRMSTGRMFGFEALVRWQHPERGILEPLDFISLAEETGLIVPLGRWVLGEACRQTVDWQTRFGSVLRGTGMSLPVGINLSGRHLAQPELVLDVAAALKSSGLAPGDLVLEMTESMLVHDNRATLERLHALKSLGVRLSIDDFGTGYSSLAYLERFPVDSLKMDRSFIVGLGIDQRKAPLAEAVIGLGRVLGLKVVAEGIETPEQWDRLRALGCGLGQGFHISHPLPAADFESYIRTVANESRGLRNGRFPLGLNGGLRRRVTGLVTTV